MGLSACDQDYTTWPGIWSATGMRAVITGCVLLDQLETTPISSRAETCATLAAAARRDQRLR